MPVSASSFEEAATPASAHPTEYVERTKKKNKRLKEKIYPNFSEISLLHKLLIIEKNWEHVLN